MQHAYYHSTKLYIIYNSFYTKVNLCVYSLNRFGQQKYYRNLTEELQRTVYSMSLNIY